MLDVNWNFVYLQENLAPDTLNCLLRTVQFVCAIFPIPLEDHYIVQLKHQNVPQHTENGIFISITINKLASCFVITV